MASKPDNCYQCGKPLQWEFHGSNLGDSWHAKCCGYDYCAIGEFLMVEKEEDCENTRTTT